jgi:long-chain acyl-CoA synthetase
MVGVPAVWELIRKGIVGKVEKSGGLKKSIFNKALGAKQFATDYRIPGLSGLTDKVVFNAVKAQTGGRLKIALSGGGSISASTQEFVSNAVVQLIQGGSARVVGMRFRRC